MYEAFFTATMEQYGLDSLQCQTCNIEEGLPSWESARESPIWMLGCLACAPEHCKTL